VAKKTLSNAIQCSQPALLSERQHLHNMKQTEKKHLIRSQAKEWEDWPYLLIVRGHPHKDEGLVAEEERDPTSSFA
jgi:hypothetical protein